MKTMKKIGFLTLALISLVACKDSPEDTDLINGIDPDVNAIVHIETLFDERAFSSPAHLKLLKELDICDTMITESSPCATCTPDHFKFHSFKNDVKIEDAFILQVRALSVLKGQEKPLPMRHLIVFERENGELVKVNGFRGNLIATRESTTGVKDLIIRFYIPEDEAFLNCLFTWETNQYKFKSVEAINGAGGNGPVKESMKDSVSVEVYKSLMSNAMLF